MTVLLPGEYLFEIETTQPAAEGTLINVLGRAGFSQVLFDEKSLSGQSVDIIGRDGRGGGRGGGGGRGSSSRPGGGGHDRRGGGGGGGHHRRDRGGFGPGWWGPGWGPDVVYVVDDNDDWPEDIFAGSSASSQAGVIRFAAIVTQPTSVNDLECLRWRLMRKLRVSPYSGLVLVSQPFKTLNKSFYDLKFLSLDRPTTTREGHPTREHVVAGLQKLGFQPCALMVVKRNVRLPGRPNMSLTEWIAFAQWTKPADVIADDRPFHFEDIKECVSDCACSPTPARATPNQTGSIAMWPPVPMPPIMIPIG